jgi:hypothetical protein
LRSFRGTGTGTNQYRPAPTGTDRQQPVPTGTGPAPTGTGYKKSYVTIYITYKVLKLLEKYAFNYLKWQQIQ